MMMFRHGWTELAMCICSLSLTSLLQAPSTVVQSAASASTAAGWQTDVSLADTEATILHIAGNLTGTELTRDQPLASQGLDSLVAMELRQKLQVGPGMDQ